MHLDFSSDRAALNLTKEEAQDLIDQLTRACMHCVKPGAAWFGTNVLMVNESEGTHEPGRLTFRVEKE